MHGHPGDRASWPGVVEGELVRVEHQPGYEVRGRFGVGAERDDLGGERRPGVVPAPGGLALGLVAADHPHAERADGVHGLGPQRGGGRVVGDEGVLVVQEHPARHVPAGEDQVRPGLRGDPGAGVQDRADQPRQGQDVGLADDRDPGAGGEGGGGVPFRVGIEQVEDAGGQCGGGQDVRGAGLPTAGGADDHRRHGPGVVPHDDVDLAGSVDRPAHTLDRSVVHAWRGEIADLRDRVGVDDRQPRPRGALSRPGRGEQDSVGGLPEPAGEADPVGEQIGGGVHTTSQDHIEGRRIGPVDTVGQPRPGDLPGLRTVRLRPRQAVPVMLGVRRGERRQLG
ncbi:hypothetical protein Ae331Ps2_6344c [Pseudonocardia sp. Ae331_Ps2]|nr:hypothetical protein Ae331Ps2_6344c [Pseudonocardia sp. Ae331_Ps2]